MSVREEGSSAATILTYLAGTAAVGVSLATSTGWWSIFLVSAKPTYRVTGLRTVASPPGGVVNIGRPKASGTEVSRVASLGIIPLSVGALLWAVVAAEFRLPFDRVRVKVGLAAYSFSISVISSWIWPLFFLISEQSNQVAISAIGSFQSEIGF